MSDLLVVTFCTFGLVFSYVDGADSLFELDLKFPLSNTLNDNTEQLLLCAASLRLL